MKSVLSFSARKYIVLPWHLDTPADGKAQARQTSVRPRQEDHSLQLMSDPSLSGVGSV